MVAIYRSRGRLGEEVGRQERSSDTSVKLCIAVVYGINDGILKATRILETQMELAISGVILNACPGTDVRLERVEAKGYDLWSERRIS